MAFFDDLSKTVTKLGQDVSQKTQTFTDGVKISNQISEQKKHLATLYEELGRIAIKDEALCAKAEVQNLPAMINAGEEKLRELERQQSLNKGEGHCKNCNASLSEGAAFCTQCGTPVNK